MKVAFTTLACPDWGWDKVVAEASRLGYDGLELRIVDGELNLAKAKPMQPENLSETLGRVQQAGLEICCIDTSCMFHDKFDDALQEGRDSIQLAAALQAPYVRVFGDAIPDPLHEAETLTQVAKGLDILGAQAAEHGIQVLLEMHGGFSTSERVCAVLDRTRSDAVGVLWDINNCYKIGRETMEYTFERLGSRIKHIHIKDSIGYGTEERLVLTGQGDVPVEACLHQLLSNGYDGWLSFEWEKKWHPDIEEPEIALPHYISYVERVIRG